MSSRRAAHILLLAALAVGAPLACEEPPPPAPTPPSVGVARPLLRSVEPYREFTGNTRAVESAEIRARVPGTLDAMLFEPSTAVAAGDVLFEIERAPYQAEYDKAVADLRSAERELALAEADLGRVESAGRAVSRQDIDRARAQRDLAAAAVQAARARRDQARIQLDYTRVTTPISGLVGRNLVDVGNLVGASEPTLLTTVTRIQPIYVYFRASEDAVLEALHGERATGGGDRFDGDFGRVRVATADDDGFPHEGRIDFVGNTVDPTTGTIEVRAVLPNAERALFSGLFVRVRVLGDGPEEALLVDERAVGSDMGGKYLLLVDDDGVVEQRYVELGALQPDGTIVVEEGLAGDERYIVEGLLRARPGFPVTAEEARSAAAAGAPAPRAGSLATD